MKKVQLGLFFGVFLILVVVRLLELGRIPPGLSNDEVNIGYEAWSISTTGRDQWNRPWPLTFEGFGNWSLPVYIYLLAPFIRVFGPSIGIVRILSVFAGIVMSVAAYGIVRILRGSFTHSLLAAVFVGLTPWTIGITRTATEAPLAMAFFMIGVFFFLSLKQHQGNLIISAIFLVLSLWTYYGMWGFIPIWLFFSILGDRTQLLKLRKPILTAAGSVIGIGVSLILLISWSQRGNARLHQVSFLRDPAIVGVLNSKRGSCQTVYPVVVCRILFNRPVLYLSTFAVNYVSHFSFKEWFLTNSSKGILPDGGYFLLAQGPLLFFGVITLLVKGSPQQRRVFFIWILAAPIAASLTGPGNFARSFTIAPLVSIICAYGFLSFPALLRLFLGPLLFFSWVSFFVLYTSHFPIFHSPFTHYEYKPLVEALGTASDVPIYLSSRVRDTKQYLFYLWYAQIQPREFQHVLPVDRVIDQDGWIWVKRVGNWNFVKSLPSIDDVPNAAVLIGSTKEEIQPFMKQLEQCKGVDITPLSTIEFLNGDPAFTIITVSKKEVLGCPTQQLQ